MIYSQAGPWVNILHMELIEQILDFGIAMMATVPVTAFLCRYRIRRGKRVSYGTVIAGACVVAFIWLVIVSFGECFTPGFWSETGPGKHTEGSWWMRLVGFVAVICCLPAIAVVAYYQKRGKRVEPPVT